MSRYPIALIALLMLAGCKTAPERIVVPQLVKVPVDRYIQIPERLTRPCPIAELEDRTVESVVEVANARRLALEACNGQLREIRGLGND